MASGALLAAGALVAVPATADEVVGDPLVDHMVTSRAGQGATGADRSSGAGDSAADQKPARRTAVIRTFDTDSAPSNRQGVQRVRVAQNLNTGRINVRATFRAAPTAAANSALFVYLGEWRGNSCLRRVSLAGTAVGQGQAGQFLTGDDFPFTSVAALGFTKKLSGNVLTFTSTDRRPRIRNADWDCAFFDVTGVPEEGQAPPVHQLSELVDLDEHYPPLLAMNLGDRLQGNYRAKWTTMRIEVRNTSLGDAPNVRIRPRGPGLNFQPKVRKLGKIGARSTKYGVQFRVRLKGKNPKKKRRQATFTALSGGKKFNQRVTIAEKPRPKKVKSLAGRYYWGHLPASMDKGWDNRALWFVNRNWVHIGFSNNGAKPKCGPKVKACKRYKYNPRTGVVRFGGKQGKVTTEGFRFKATKKDPRIFYYPTTLARKGQRFNVSLMRNNFTGNCLIFCTTTTQRLSMDRKGRFVLTSMSITSLGTPGLNTLFARVPADQKGRYRVNNNGRVVLNYANGTTRRHTLAIEHNIRGKAAPQVAGLVLGDRNFYN